MMTIRISTNRTDLFSVFANPIINRTYLETRQAGEDTPMRSNQSPRGGAQQKTDLV